MHLENKHCAQSGGWANQPQQNGIQLESSCRNQLTVYGVAQYIRLTSYQKRQTLIDTNANCQINESTGQSIDCKTVNQSQSANLLTNQSLILNKLFNQTIEQSQQANQPENQS